MEKTFKISRTEISYDEIMDIVSYCFGHTKEEAAKNIIGFLQDIKYPVVIEQSCIECNGNCCGKMDDDKPEGKSYVIIGYVNSDTALNVITKNHLKSMLKGTKFIKPNDNSLLSCNLKCLREHLSILKIYDNL